ncbi:hypothetical protein BDW72DRAFT_204955 [Aspergillus terricola var. indicus]
MPPPSEKAFSIYELIERILLQLDNYLEITRAQRVCRTWRDIVQTSPALQTACWYRFDSTNDTKKQPTPGKQPWKLNPVFNRIGVSVSKDDSRGVGLDDKGDFSLQERIYDTPGSWTTMLATQPPCQRMVVECYSDYSGDETMYYLIISMTGYLLMGDIMAVLAECQNRQQYGLDRWVGVRHYTGRLVRWKESDWDICDWTGLGKMPDEDVSIKEMILHRMITEDGHEYEWVYKSMPRAPKPVPCKGEYKANLLVVREHHKGYLSDCSHIFRLISDIELRSI